jgi:hypothetical protein
MFSALQGVSFGGKSYTRDCKLNSKDQSVLMKDIIPLKTSWTATNSDIMQALSSSKDLHGLALGTETYVATQTPTFADTVKGEEIKHAYENDVATYIERDKTVARFCYFKAVNSLDITPDLAIKIRDGLLKLTSGVPRIH